jgi:hypothetical protein
MIPLDLKPLLFFKIIDHVWKQKSILVKFNLKEALNKA